MRYQSFVEQIEDFHRMESGTQTRTKFWARPWRFFHRAGGLQSSMFISPVRPLRVMAHAEAVTHSCESPMLLQGPRGPILALMRGSSSCESGPQDLCFCQQFSRLSFKDVMTHRPLQAPKR